MNPINPDPSSLLQLNPPLSLFSSDNLTAVIVYALAANTPYALPNNLDALLRDSARLTILSDPELLQAIASIALNPISPATMDQITDGIRGLAQRDPKAARAALVFLLCLTTNQNMNLLSSGVAQLAGGTATVLDANASSTNVILLSYFSLDGNNASVSYGTIVPGVSFKITSSYSQDTNLVSWAILKP